MIRIGLIGCGRIGRVHAGTVAAHPRLSLTSVCDADEGSAASVAAAHGALVAESTEAVIADPGLDAVLIASPTGTHADLIEASVAAGKPIFCEKPIDLSLERILRCAVAVEGSGVPIQLGFNRRFDPGHRAAYDALQSGEIGDLLQVIITSRDPDFPGRGYLTTSGGLLRDMTIHDFDMARFMLGEEVTEVFAVAGAVIDPTLADEMGDADCAMITLRTASGRMAQINNSRRAVYGHDQRIELLGTEGMLISGNRKEHETVWFGAGRSEQAAPYQNFFIERYAQAYALQLDAFADALETGAPCAPSLQDGVNAARLAEAAYLSIAERRMIRVDEIA